MMFTYDKSEYRDELLWFRQEAKYDPERAKAHPATTAARCSVAMALSSAMTASTG